VALVSATDTRCTHARQAPWTPSRPAHSLPVVAERPDPDGPEDVGGFSARSIAGLKAFTAQQLNQSEAQGAEAVGSEARAEAQPAPADACAEVRRQLSARRGCMLLCMSSGRRQAR